MRQTVRPFLIAVTGGIGSGKSIVCRHLQSLGYKVFYADIIADNIRQKPQNISSLTKEFGVDIADDGNLSKVKLAEVVFSDPKKLQFLNNLIHPQVRAEMQQIIDENQTEEILFFEIPLLFESELEAAFDFTVNISAKLHNRIERIIKRDEVSIAEVLQRISSQMPDEEKKTKADVTIQNNNNINDLIAKVATLLKKIPTLSKKSIKKITDL